MEAKRGCCVPGCKDIASKRHRFPKNDEELFNIWKRNIRHPRFEDLSPQQIYRSYFVCDRHFAQEFIVPGTQRGLRRDAVPTLFLSTISDDYPMVEERNPDECTSGSVRGLDWGELAAQEEAMVIKDQHARTEKHVTTFEEAGSSKSPACSYDVESSTILTSSSELVLSGELPSCSYSMGSSSPIMTSPNEPLSSGELPRTTKRGILSEISVTKEKHLTPKCKVLYKKAVTLARKAAKLTKKATSFRKRLAQAEKLSRTTNFNNLIDHVNESTYNFILQQVRNQNVPPKGRRFTVEEKIFSLALLKSSAKGYRFLSKIFALPSSRTLLNLLQKITLRPGINNQLFQTLALAVEKMKQRDKCCSLIFDEMAIYPNLQYSQKHDVIDGFEDYGYKNSAKIADHVNVFMVKGISKQWKQPLACTFSYGPAKSSDLKELILKLVSKCQQIGLDVVCTICDQGAANQAAINSLLRDTAAVNERAAAMKTFFIINNAEIVPLFDIPHLFKGIRNNMLVRVLQFRHNGKVKFAKWQHIQDFYMLDNSDNIRMCPKLTDKHVFVDKMNKMKVSLCTQVFSHRVGTLMKRISQWEVPGLEKEAGDTADFILLMDELFDSLNASQRRAPIGKQYKGAVTATSEHDGFWRKSINLLRTVQFMDPKKHKLITVPSIANLIKTLERLLYLKDILLQQKQFSFILTRALNQDSIENLFSCIRGQGGCSTKPTASQFMSLLKTQTVTNFMSRHSPSANCEADQHEGALDTLRSLLLQEEIPGVAPLDAVTTTSSVTLPSTISTQKRTRIEECTINYFAGYVMRKSLKKTANCDECHKLLTHSDKEGDMSFIEARTYSHAKLFKPGSFLAWALRQTLSRLFYILPRISKEKCVLSMIKNHISKEININVLNCKIHPLGEIVLDVTCKCMLYFWCKKINLILRGNDVKFQLFMRTKPNLTCVDPIKLQAHQMYLKNSKRRSK